MLSSTVARALVALAAILITQASALDRGVRAQQSEDSTVFLEASLGLVPRIEGAAEVRVSVYGPVSLNLAVQRWSDSDEVVSVPQKLDHQGTSVTIAVGASTGVAGASLFVQAELGRHFFSDGLDTTVTGGRYGVRYRLGRPFGVVAALRHHRLSSFRYPDPFGDVDSFLYEARWLHSGQVGFFLLVS